MEFRALGVLAPDGSVVKTSISGIWRALHGLDVMGLNPHPIELRVRSTSVQVIIEQKITF